MLKKINVSIVTGLLSALSFGALAHSGHDHSDPSSGLIHLVWAAPALIAGAYASYRLLKNKSVKSQSDKDS